jgi:hypothetical protein
MKELKAILKKIWAKIELLGRFAGKHLRRSGKKGWGIGNEPLTTQFMKKAVFRQTAFRLLK